MSDQPRQSEPDVVPHEAGLPPDAVPPADTPSDEPAPDGAARPSVAPRPFGWRDETVGTAMVTLIIGVWLVFSPEALGYGPDDATVNVVVCGVLVSVFSVARLIGPWRSRTLGLLIFLIGAWLAVSSFLLEAPIEGQCNDDLYAGIIALLALIGLAGSERGRELNPE